MKYFRRFHGNENCFEMVQCGSKIHGTNQMMFPVDSKVAKVPIYSKEVHYNKGNWLKLFLISYRVSQM